MGQVGDRRTPPQGIIGMIHLLPLPGAPRWGGSMEAVVRRARAATPPPGLDLARAAHDTWERGLADALVISGAGTAEPTDLEDVRAVRNLLPEATTLVGSGVIEATIRDALAAAHGVIIGSALQCDGRPGNAVDAERVRRVVQEGRG